MKYFGDYTHLIGVSYEKEDCWGIVVEFYRSVFNVELSRYYDKIPENRDITQNLIYSNRGDFKEVISPQFGDIVTIKIYGIESHIAIYLDDSTILHTQKKTGCMIDRIAKWEKLIVGFYRIER